MKPSLVFSLVLLSPFLLRGQPGALQPAPSRSLNETLEVYAEFTGRTVLRSSFLANVAIAAQLPDDTNAAIRLIEDELRKQGIEVIPDRALFVRVVPAAWRNSEAARFLATLNPPSPEGERFPGRAINWTAADFGQVLAFYREIRSRTLLQPNLAPIVLKTRQAMSKNEVSYAITVLLAINGVAAVDEGEKFVQLVPVPEWREVQPRAPIPGTNEPLFDPKKIPKSPPGPPTATAKRLDQLYLQLFHNQPPWTPRPVDQLVEIYADLTDQKAAPSKIHGQNPVRFDIRTPLTKEELLYAIETTIKLNGLAIANVEANRISAVSLSEKLRLEKQRVSGSKSP
jgi:hypothetical protein